MELRNGWWLFLCLLGACAGSAGPGETVPVTDASVADTAAEIVVVLDTAGVEVVVPVDSAPAELPPTVCAGDPLLHDVPMSTDMDALQQRFDANAELLRILVILSPG